MRWMNLEPIIQSKVSQKQKKKMQYINAYIWNLEKNDIDGPICREGMEMQM